MTVLFPGKRIVMDHIHLYLINAGLIPRTLSLLLGSIMILMGEAVINPEKAGEIIGAVMVAGLLLWGAIACIRMLWRSDANKPCIIAMLLSLLCLAGMYVFQPLIKALPQAKTYLSILQVVWLLFGAFTILVLAIVGLCTFDRRRYTRGRWQAIVALFFSLCCFAGNVFYIGHGLRLRHQQDLALDMASVQPQINEKFNFSLTPQPRWRMVSPGAYNKLACLALRHARPEGYILVIGEHLEANIPLDQIASNVRDNLVSSAEKIRSEQTSRETIAGLEFIRRRSHVTHHPGEDGSRTPPLFFDQWITTKPGFSWQITAWGPLTNEKKLTPDIEKIARSFLVIDPQLTGDPAKALRNASEPALGFQTRLEEKKWSRWTPERIPLHRFGALRPAEAIVVLPVDLGAPAPELGVLSAPLVARIGIEMDENWKKKPWSSPWGEGVEHTGLVKGGDGSEFSYILRIAANGQIAQLHAGWYMNKDGGDEALLRSALDAVTLSPPGGAFPESSPAQKNEIALLQNDIGIALYNMDNFKAAIPWFQMASAGSVTDSAMFGNLIDTLRKDGQAAAALEKLVPGLKAFPDKPSLHIHHAELLADRGDIEGGSAAFLKAIATGLKDDSTVLDWLQKLNEDDHHKAAVAAAEAWMQKNPDVNSRCWHAQVISLAGEPKRGIELLEALHKDFPEDRRAAYDLAEALNEDEQYDRAAAMAEKILSGSPEATRALMVLGWSQMGKKWYREAKATFEKAAAKAPEAENVKDALARASAMLGQGSNSDIKTPIAAVELPGVLDAHIAAHKPPADFGSDQPYFLLLSADGYHWDKGKPLRKTSLRRVRILTTQGANEYSSIDRSFDPLLERIFINRVIVTDENGKVSSPEKITDDAYVMDLDNGQGTSRKKLHFQVPGLRPGCVLEYQITTEERSTRDEFPFKRHYFSDCAVDAVFVTGDAVGEVLSATTNFDGAHGIKEKGLRAWYAFDQPFEQSEPYSTFFEERVPGVTLVGKEGSWEKIGSEYLEDIAALLAPDEKIRDLAAELTREAKNEREKIAALARHVQKHIRYTAIEFGIRARRPNRAAHTLEKGYGDCKDQSLLLHQLLGGVGIESHLALVDTEWHAQPALPSMDQFNHMVLHVPGLGSDFLLDPTNSVLDLAAWPADDLWHSHTLILQPQKVRLAPPRGSPPPDSARVESQRTLRQEGDAWRVRETLTAHGYYAAWLRGSFQGLDGPQTLRKGQSLLESYGPLHINEIDFKNLETLHEPAVLVLDYDIPDAFQKQASGHRAVLPSPWEREYLSAAFVKNRRTDFNFVYPFEYRSTVAFEGFPATLAAALKEHPKAAKGRHTQHSMELDTANPGRPVLRFRFRVTPGPHSAAEYAAWQQEWNQALQVWDTPLLLAR